ncbi:hypothetical protein [Streptomyces virginiae]|uniref:hypothetical protein n=1 Tax=Streptomyces virginiae TaxID=1961 RepID=UPI002E27C17C|nr:hypothetical protein [Streptomyces virginiae]
MAALVRRHRPTPDLIGLPAERCVFVDDHAQKLPPAAELGVTTVHAQVRTRL